MVLLNSQQNAIKLFKELVIHFVEKSICDADEGDCAIEQWERLLQNQLFISSVESAFQNKPKSEWPRLDTLYWEHVGSNSDLAELWKFIRKILILPHGNAAVEKGFSVQKNQLCENFLEESMVARRRVFDYIGDTETVGDLVTPEMIKATKGSNTRYRLALQERSLKRRQTDIQKAEDIRTAKLRLLEITQSERRLEAEKKALADEKNNIRRTLNA